MFQRVDTNHSGAISKKELREALTTDTGLRAMIEQANLPKRLKFLMHHLDHNQDGLISLAEFRGAIASDAMHQLFEAIDVNQDGHVSREELRRKLRMDDEIQTLIKEAG